MTERTDLKFVLAAMFIPPPTNTNGKVGFSTYAMWGLCFVVVGVCYVLESRLDNGQQREARALPTEVHKVLPSGAYLMSERSLPLPGRAHARARALINDATACIAHNGTALQSSRFLPHKPSSCLVLVLCGFVIAHAEDGSIQQPSNGRQ